MVLQKIPGSDTCQCQHTGSGRPAGNQHYHPGLGFALHFMTDLLPNLRTRFVKVQLSEDREHYHRAANDRPA